MAKRLPSTSPATARCDGNAHEPAYRDQQQDAAAPASAEGAVFSKFKNSVDLFIALTDAADAVDVDMKRGTEPPKKRPAESARRNGRRGGMR